MTSMLTNILSPKAIWMGLLLCAVQAVGQTTHPVDLHLQAIAEKTHRHDIEIYACQFLAGSADGVNQALVHHYLGMGTHFWDFQTSWKNKYRNYDKGDLQPAFLGSKSIFVGFTDGYHLTRTIDRSFTSVSLALALTEKNSFKQVVKKVLTSTLINRAGFLLFFNVIFPRRGGGLNH